MDGSEDLDWAAVCGCARWVVRVVSQDRVSDRFCEQVVDVLAPYGLKSLVTKWSRAELLVVEVLAPQFMDELFNVVLTMHHNCGFCSTSLVCLSDRAEKEKETEVVGHLSLPSFFVVVIKTN